LLARFLERGLGDTRQIAAVMLMMIVRVHCTDLGTRKPYGKLSQ
jgi:hypothetical protein